MAKRAHHLKGDHLYAFRRELTKRQGGRCFYCGVKLAMYRRTVEMPQHNRMMTIDHIIPRSQGGGTNFHNCVAACFRCNQDRATMPADVFLILRVQLKAALDKSG